MPFLRGNFSKIGMNQHAMMIITKRKKGKEKQDVSFLHHPDEEYKMTINFKKFYERIILIFFIVLLINKSIICNDKSQKKIDFWNISQKGANIFNQNITLEDIKTAKEYGIKFIRLAPDKFLTSHRDFLIGDADNYQGLIKEDLDKLKSILDLCLQEKMPVVITMLSLPGSRWQQNNQDKDDLRIWMEEKYQLQAIRFWQDLAIELKDHPIIKGYNILNEPHPERLFEEKEVHINTVQQEKVQGMLYDFYNRSIKSIRIIDTETPIILDSSAYADAQTFSLLRPHEDKNILYSFHIYEPYEYTNYEINQDKFSYPGEIKGKEWNATTLHKYLLPVINFQKKYGIPHDRILVGEFGGHRISAGLEKYFQDLITLFTQEKWHFAFYAFREDTWEGMDYELGDEKLPCSYWETLERGEKPNLNRKDTYPAFAILKKALEEKRS